ncbi:DNA-directed DNA polymerase [Methanolobus halotolerans]|uniref:DNA polymerase n=1 Tax=Methanolobus halotolerans TaxID=2052935 RepID=A0A4E0PSH1_9EURY|nr:DNA-directed DNA polymerase [Methanolobus halotolerans]TGC06782.1 DNA polymerase elongation subunit [Methanolobus halotolerans]
MNFQILDADYIREDKGPVIRLFGRKEDGKSVCCFVPGFEPYFYVNITGDPDSAGEILKERFSSAIKRVEVVRKLEPVGYQVSKKPMLKVVTYDPGNVPEIRDDISNIPAVKGIYETDILFRNRFLIDRELHGMSWVKAGPLSESPFSGEEARYCDEVFTATSLEEIEKLSNAPLKNLAFDIECLPLGGSMPVPETSPVIMISLSFSPAFKGYDTMVLVSKDVEGVAGNVECLGNEATMLGRFFEIFQQYDPDIVSGYNVIDFDIPYIADRVNILNESGNSLKSVVGRDGRILSYRKIGNRTMVSIPGRVVVDALPLIRSQYSLKRYTLRNVAKELLDREKLDVAPSEMEEYWQDTGEKILHFIDYAQRDSELALELCMKLRLLDKYIAIARVSGSLLQEVVDGGQTSMVENLLLREYGKRDRVIPPKPSDDLVSFRNRSSEGLKGGEVLEPKKGLLEDIVILDYKSLYPTIMMAHNLCYTTVVEHDRPDSETIKPPSGGEFVSAEVSKGIMPSILENLLNRRVETKNLMKNAANEGEYRVLDATQLALKILLNSFYGYSGYTRARLYSLALANAVTSFGRGNILNTRAIVNGTINKVVLRDSTVFFTEDIDAIGEDDRIVALSVVYGDTDSVFVQCSSEDPVSLEDAELVGNKIAGNVSASLPDPMELEFESIARRALFIAKKRYAIWVFERSGDEWKDSIKVKGMETVRRDWCELTSKTLNRVLELVLKEGDVDAAVSHVREIVDGVRNIDVQKDEDIIDDLTMTRMFSKSASRYKNKQPHLTVVEKIEERTGAPPPVGERIPFVIVAGRDLFVNRAEDPEYVREHNVPIDVDYYVKKQILPPVERILGVFGVDIANLDYDSKQKGLFDFSDKPKEIPLNNIKKREEKPSDDSQAGNAQSSLFDF